MLFRTIHPKTAASFALLSIRLPAASVDTVAIGKPERQVRKASHWGSKQQESSHAAITLLLLVRATYIWCCSLHTFRSWWTAHFSTTPTEWLQ